MAEAAVRGAPGHSITGKTWSGPKSIDNSEFHCLAQSGKGAKRVGKHNGRSGGEKFVMRSMAKGGRICFQRRTLLRLVSPSQNSSCDVACQDCFRSVRVFCILKAKTCQIFASFNKGGGCGSSRPALCIRLLAPYALTCTGAIAVKQRSASFEAIHSR